MEIEENYRERRIQLNKPVQPVRAVRRKRQYHRKNRKIVSMCEHLKGWSVLERRDPANPALHPGAVCTRRTGIGRQEDSQPESTWIGKWKMLIR